MSTVTRLVDQDMEKAPAEAHPGSSEKDVASERLDAEHSEEHLGLKAIYDKNVHRHNVTLGRGDADGTNWSSYAVAAVMSFNLFTAQMALSMTGSQAVFIARDLNAVALQGWFGSAQLLAASAAYPVSYYLSDHLGRKEIMMFGQVGVFVGSIIASRAQGPAQLIAGLVIIGICHACIVPLLVASALSDVVPIKVRSVFLGILDIGGSLAVGTAALLAGALTTKTQQSWRSVFYLEAGFCVLAFVLTYGYHPITPPRTESVKSILMGLDWFGCVFLLACTLLTMLGLLQATTYPWSSGLVLGPFITGLCLYVLFIIYSKVRKNGVINKELFTFFNFPISGVLTFLSGWFLFGVPTFIPILLTTYYGSSALRVGVLNLVQNGTYFAITSVATASISWFHGSFRPLLSFGFAIGAIGFGLYSTIAPTDGVQKYLGFSALVGISTAITSGMSLSVCQHAVTHKNLGIAVGLTNVTRAVGGVLSIACFFTLFSNRLSSELPKLVPAAAVEAGLSADEVATFIGALTTGNAAALEAIPGITPEIIAAGTKALQDSYFYAFKAVFWAGAAFCAAGVPVTLIAHPIKPERLTDDVPIKQAPYYSMAFGRNKHYKETAYAEYAARDAALQTQEKA